MANPFARIIAQLAVASAGIVSRAFVSAYSQAVHSKFLPYTMFFVFCVPLALRGPFGLSVGGVRSVAELFEKRRPGSEVSSTSSRARATALAIAAGRKVEAD